MDIPIEVTMAQDGTVNVRVLPGPGTDAEALERLRKLIGELVASGVSIDIVKPPESHRHGDKEVLVRDRIRASS
jgi:hypothetical protein